MKTALFVLLALPEYAFSDDGASQGYSFWASLLQMLAALAFVVGLILLAKYLSGKLFGARFNSAATKHIRIVETRYLGPKKSLLLVEVGGEYLLLANSEESLTLLTKVNMIENIEVLEEGPDKISNLMSLFRPASGKEKRS